MTLSESEQLLRRASELARAGHDSTSESYWQAVAALHGTPDQAVFDACVVWCASPNAAERRLAADVLGQLGFEGHAYPFKNASFPLLRRLLSDTDPDVVSGALNAFGHLGTQGSLDAIVPLARSESPEVRHAVAFALLGVESPEAVATLIELSRDPSSDVRDWATFGLGAQIDADTPEIREALLARGSDPDPDTRAEALAGLVKRRDPRALEPLLQALRTSTVGSMEVEAAGHVGSTELVGALEALRSWWDVDDELLESAIRRCSRNLGYEVH